jgi:hypothetical protein
LPIKFRSPDNLKDTLLEDLIGEAIQEGFEPLGDSLVNSLKAEWPEDTGKSKKSIRKRISGAGFKTRMLIYASAESYEWVEKGRPKGAKQPPPPVMLAYVRRKGLGKAYDIRTRKLLRGPDRAGKLRTGKDTLLRKQKSIAFLVGRKIKRDGIPGKFLFRDLRQNHAPEISATYSQIQTRIAELLND